MAPTIHANRISILAFLYFVANFCCVFILAMMINSNTIKMNKGFAKNDSIHSQTFINHSKILDAEKKIIGNQDSIKAQNKKLLEHFNIH